MAADDLVEALPGQLAAAEVHEQMRLGRPSRAAGTAALQVHPQRLERGLSDRHHALLGALPARAQDALLDVHVHQLEPDRLRGAQAAGVQQLEQGAVAQRRWLGAARLREQLLDLAAGQYLRQLAPAPGR